MVIASLGTMRLIDTSTLRFEEFFDKPIPQYAILSHRWQEGETSYHDYLATAATGSRRSCGYEKILQFCSLVRKFNPPQKWAWIDTCCIDKKSSSEVAEAINSMYAWYRNAGICVVYLHDLPSKSKSPHKDRLKAFQKCDWFTRGWTLQELLAPVKAVFYDHDWEIFGDRGKLLESISVATGIPKRFVGGQEDVQKASVAMRMSWVSRRETTKLEDIAYCALGIFGVNMPLLYGEREKAFMRLQLEIIKKSDDESIFAWISKDASSGMLATSPNAFRESGRFVNLPLFLEERRPYSMTNKGLLISSASDTSARSVADDSTGTLVGYDTHCMQLGCFRADRSGMMSDDSDAEEMWENGALTIFLERRGPCWVRVNCNQLGVVSNEGRRKRSNGTFQGRATQREYLVEQPGL